MRLLFVHLSTLTVALVLAILFNCSEPESITLALARIAADSILSNRLQASGVLLGAYANRLTQVDPNWTLQESEMLSRGCVEQACLTIQLARCYQRSQKLLNTCLGGAGKWTTIC